MNKAEIVFNKIAQGYHGSGGQVMKKSITPGNSGFTARSVSRFQTGAGPRFYLGKSTNRSMSNALNSASHNSLLKFKTNPADSMTTKQYNLFK